MEIKYHFDDSFFQITNEDLKRSDDLEKIKAEIIGYNVIAMEKKGHNKPSDSDGKHYKCLQCDRYFKTMTCLRNHTNSHQGLKPYVCVECSQTFTTIGDLGRHTKYKHTLIKSHKCSMCDIAFVERSKLQRHMRTHTGEKPYQCTSCGDSFGDSFKLKRHTRLHTGDRPYKCLQCDTAFAHNKTLKAHLSLHKMMSDPVCACKCTQPSDDKTSHECIKTFICTICGLKVMDQLSYKLHIKTHMMPDAFKCILCPYSITSRSLMKAHRETHKDMSFACKICGKTYSHRPHLIRHEKVTHNPKNVKYICDVCSKSFNYQWLLLRHFRVHENDRQRTQRNTAKIFDEVDEIQPSYFPAIGDDDEGLPLMQVNNIQNNTENLDGGLFDNNLYTDDINATVQVGNTDIENDY